MKNMTRIQKQREYHKRWLRKRPEYAIYRLRLWIEKEKNPRELARAQMHLKRYLDREKNKK
ncbi:unnamed protein product [marine sediment metagenome]|uniref:Uncharacterized protein n=1 Tax=marine sediment metagenome TaxID=412755 RepID=X1M083_9ZZZZ